MTKSIVALALVIVFAATPAYAAMPNYMGFGYKQAPECQLSTDHGVYAQTGNVLEGCWTDEAWQRSISDAIDLQNTGYVFGAGETVTLKNGTTDTCPWWFGSIKCVISRSLLF